LPVVITIHGADLQIHIHKNLRLQKHILSIISKADAIGLVSQKLFQILDRYITQQQRKKLNIIHNGIQIYNNYDNVEWGDDEKNIRIITIANLIEQKGFKYVFKALGELREKFKNITYFIIGSGWDEDRIKRQAREHGLEKEVKFLGKMPHKVAMSYLKNADIFIMLSENESFGIVYIEAMYLKTITIGSIGEGISEVISNNENGFLVNPKNSQNIKELLEYILKNYKHMSELKEKAHSDVWPKFSWRNNAKLYIDLYKNIQKNFHNS
jgi:teichuronic acid biosynthesis glycosyltransferase TuaC